MAARASKTEPPTPIFIDKSLVLLEFSENALFRHEVRFVTTLQAFWLHFGDQNGTKMVPGASKVTFKS